MGALERSKGGFEGGCCSIKIRNFHLPYFGVMFEKGPDFFFNDRKGYVKNMNSIRLSGGRLEMF